MEAFLQLFRNMGQTRLLAVLGSVALVIALFIFMSTRVSSAPMSPVYTDLSLDDSAKIVAELEKNNTPYELRGNGTQVLVPSDQVLRLRLSLAQQGLPSGGSIVGYEIFDRSETMGTSSFVMNVNMLRALEGELSRTIASLSQVESARVRLVIPKQELFTRDKQEPTASIMIKLRGISELTKEQIASITHLTAAAVPGLKPSKVTLIDSKGQMLSAGTGDDESSTMSGSSNEYRQAYENRMKGTLEALLEKSLGQGKVKVTVTADMDFDRIVTNSETYDPNGQVVRSTQTGEEKEQSTDSEGKANTSVSNNLPGAGANQTANGSNRLIDKTDETTNYEISKTVQNHIQEGGKINKVSVAVMVDGNYADDAKTGKPVYAPRTDAEVKDIDTLVKGAIGYDEKRGDKVNIVNMRFMAAEETASNSPLEWIKEDLHSIVQTVVFGGVAVLVILLVIRPLVTRIIETTMASGSDGAEGDAALAGAAFAGAGGGTLGGGIGGGGGFTSAEAPPEEEGSIDISRITGRVKSSTYNRLNDLVEKHPDEALNVIRQWTTKRT